MQSRHSLLAPAALAAVLASCAQGAGTTREQSGADPRAALDAVTSDIMKLPITTGSTEARAHFLRGQREADLQRFIDANAHFKEAIAADSGFASAYLNAANTANSLDEFKTDLALAERHAAGASEAEQLLIRMARKGLDNDLSGQLAVGEELVQKHRDSPRAWLALAGVQGALNRNQEARSSLAKALELAPRMFAAHAALGNSYLFGEPRDFAKALEHMKQAESLAPNEPGPHDLLGDVYRAQRNLAQAAAEYTRGHELSPKDAILLQQRGHVNTFLGNYAAARADYDSAIALGRANEKAAYAPFRAYVSVYAGDPGAAIDELNQLVANVDSMGVPDPATAKAGALTNVAVIAIHTRRFPAAEAALKQLAPVLLKQADAVGTPAFRRTQLATITYFQGWLAARRGNYVKALQAADSVTQLVAPDSNPRKMEPVHQLRGLVALYARDYPAAALHLDQGNLLDPYIKYQLALAEEGAGNAERAKQLFREVATYNFNNLGFALVRKEAQQKAGPNTSS